VGDGYPPGPHNGKTSLGTTRQLPLYRPGEQRQWKEADPETKEAHV
jgi:hypothetical protein